MTRAPRTGPALVPALAGAVLLAGCSVGAGTLTQVPRYQEVEAAGM